MAVSHLFGNSDFGRAHALLLFGWSGGRQPPLKGTICHVYLVIPDSNIVLITVIYRKITLGSFGNGNKSESAIAIIV